MGVPEVGYPLSGTIYQVPPHLGLTGGTQGGVPPSGTPRLDLAWVPPNWTWLRYPLAGPGWGTPSLDLAGVPPLAGPGRIPPPPHLDLAQVPPPQVWTDRQTRVKT